MSATSVASGSPQVPPLVAACRNPDAYPENVPHSRDSTHALQVLSKQLKSREGHLLDPDSGYGWGLLEAYDNQDYEEAECTDKAQLEKHLSRRGVDPSCRFVFMQSDHSAAPLDGSRAMLTYLLSFHHVMPRFLRLLFLCGRQQVVPSDQHCFHAGAFHHENVLERKRAEPHQNEALGRSGIRIQHCYNLWGAEKDKDEPDRDSRPSLSWRIRQTTTYHSFDVVTGKAVWLNIKPNDGMKERMTQVAREERKPAAGTSETEKLGVAFANTLDMHVVAAEWCGENWAVYIQAVESEIRMILDKLKNLPVAEVEHTLEVDTGALMREYVMPADPESQSAPALVRAASSFYQSSTRGGAPPNPATTPEREPAASPLSARNRTLSGLSLKPLSRFGRRLPRGPAAGQVLEANYGRDPFKVLRDFDFAGLQRLNGLASRLQQAAHTMQLDARILSELDKYYLSLREDAAFPLSIKHGCKGDLDEFHQRLGACIETLELEQARIVTLLVAAEDGKRLFDVVIQFRNMEISKLFAATAHRMTREMQSVAEKTERETASMHIITLVTLVFLPGTFVAVRFLLGSLGLAGPLQWRLPATRLPLTGLQTFLGSGMFQWGSNPDLEFPAWRPEYFKLFCKVSFSLTAVTLAVWLAVYLRATRKGRSRSGSEPEKQPGQMV